MGNQQCCAKPTHEADHSHATKGGQPDKVASTHESPAAFAGWVEKLGVIHKTWKRRWFRLEGTRLAYSTSPKSSKCEGVIYMKTVTAVNIIGETSSWVGDHPKWNYEFEIVCDITNHVRDTVEAPGWRQKDVGKDERGVVVQHERRYRLRVDDKGMFETFVETLKACSKSATAPATSVGRTIPASTPTPDSEEGVPPAAEADQAVQEMELKVARDSVKMARLAAAADAAHKAKEEADAAAKAHAEAEAQLERAVRAKAEEQVALEVRLAEEEAAAQAAKQLAEQKEKARITAKEEAARVAQAEAAATKAAAEKAAAEAAAQAQAEEAARKAEEAALAAAKEREAAVKKAAEDAAARAKAEAQAKAEAEEARKAKAAGEAAEAARVAAAEKAREEAKAKAEEAAAAAAAAEVERAKASLDRPELKDQAKAELGTDHHDAGNDAPVAVPVLAEGHVAAIAERSEEQKKMDAEEAHKGEMGKRLKAAGAKVGALTVSLMWDNLNDLDLHCESPTGSHIFYASRVGTCTGVLDVDANASEKHSTAQPIENILWHNPPKGHYRIWVENCDGTRADGETPFNVRLTKNGLAEDKHFDDIEEYDECNVFEL